MLPTRRRTRIPARAGRFGVVVTAAIIVALAFAPAASARRLTVGMSGVDVRHLQERLAELTYLPKSAASGEFDQRTWHAVVAFQGWQGITPDGVAGPLTRKTLRSVGPPLPSSKQDGFELHLRAQVLLIVRKQRTARAVHVSTGAGGGTPAGEFHVYSRVPMSWSKKFKAWLPLAQYFNGGIALHQFGSVPAYPASHGCVRMPTEDADVVWRAGRIGTRVSVSTDNRYVSVAALARRERAQKRARRTLARMLSAMSL